MKARRNPPRFSIRRTLRDWKKNHGFEILKKAHKNYQTTFSRVKNRGTRKGLQKSHRMHILPNSYTLFSKNSDYFACVLTWNGIISMTNDILRRTNYWRDLNLTKMLPFEPKNRGGLFEIVCSDATLETSNCCLAILAVFWVETDNKNKPLKCFGSVFRVLKNLDVVLEKIIETPKMVGYCRITDRKLFTDNHHCLLIFPKNSEVMAYLVEPNKVERIIDVFNWFPSLALTNLPGGALRSSCKVSGKHRYSAVGLDSGILIVSVCTMKGNVILDSCRLKFACPLTVVEFLPEVSRSIQRLLISSYLGPAAIWRVHFENEKLRWEAESSLSGSQYQDSVICACLYRFYHRCPPWILLGTFSGKILRYELPPPTKVVRKSVKELKICGKSCTTMINQPIYGIKQSGINEISVVTPFGMTILRETLSNNKRHSELSYMWMEKYQKKKLARDASKKLDFTNDEIRKASIDSEICEMRPRVGSTLSTFTNKTDEDAPPERRRMTFTGAMKDLKKAVGSISMSSSGSLTKLKQLDISVTDLFYQDGPSDGIPNELKSPNKCAASPKMSAIQEISPPHQYSKPSQTSSPAISDRKTNFFRFSSKKGTQSQSDQTIGKVFK